MDDDLKLKKLDRDIIEADISLILMKLVKESVNEAFKGKVPDVEKYSRKIISHIKEHSVR
jgi:hypothetical protein